MRRKVDCTYDTDISYLTEVFLERLLSQLMYTKLRSLPDVGDCVMDPRCCFILRQNQMLCLKLTLIV